MAEPIPNQLSSMAPETDSPPPSPAVPPPSSRGAWVRSFVSSVMGRLMIIAVIVGAGFLLRDYLSGAAGDLQVGDCFDRQTERQTIEEVQQHPCNESHTAEVYAVFDYDAPKDAAYPGEDAIFAVAEETCVREFTEYTGTDLFDQEALDAYYLFPSPDGWTKQNDREISCALYRIDEASMTQSFRNAKP